MITQSKETGVWGGRKKFRRGEGGFQLPLTGAGKKGRNRGKWAVSRGEGPGQRSFPRGRNGKRKATLKVEVQRCGKCPAGEREER